MVARWLKYVLAGGVPLLLAALLMGSWLLWSPRGAVWLLHRVSEQTQGRFAVDRVQGCLGDNLQLEGMVVTWPEGAVRVESLALQWSPLKLLLGKLQVAELQLAGVDTVLAPPPETSAQGDRMEGFFWPQLSGWPFRLRVEIGSLRIDRSRVRRSEELLWETDRFQGRVHWQRGRLLLSQLELTAAAGSVSGQLSVDLVHRRIQGELQGRLHEAMAGITRADLALDLAAEQAGLAGRFRTLLYEQQQPWLEYDSALSWSGDLLQLCQGAVNFPGTSDALQVQGNLRFTDGLFWQAAVGVEQLNLSTLAGVPLLLHGQIRGEGDLDRYQGQLALENRVDGYLQTRLAGQFSGDLKGIDFTVLTGLFLGGSVEGDLGIGWGEQFSLHSHLQGWGLDPAALFPGWPGRVNLDLQTRMTQRDSEPLKMSFSGNLLKSTLHDKPLTGAFALRLAGGELDIDQLQLLAAGTRLTASGRLEQRLEVTVFSPSLADLLPGVQGQLQGGGWLTLQADDLAGQLSLEGKQLRYAGSALERMSLAADKALGEKGRIHIRGSQGQILEHPLDGFTLALLGDQKSQSASVSVDAPWGSGQLELSGGLQEQGWRGKLTTLTLSQGELGEWHLAQPAELQATRQSLRLEPVKLVGSREGSLALSGALQATPLDGGVELQWETFPLSASLWSMEEWSLAGTTTGFAQARFQAGELAELSARVAATGIRAGAEEKIVLQGGELELRWDEAGLAGQARLDFADSGLLQARIRSPQPARLAWPDRGEGSLHLAGMSLRQWEPWLPPSLQLSGDLSATLTGQWEERTEFSLLGAVAVAAGTVRWQEGAGTLEAALEQARLNWNWSGEVLAGQGELVLAQKGRLRGEWSLPLAARWPLAMNPQGAVRGSLAGFLQEQGLLTALFPGLVRESRGRIDLNASLAGSWSQPDLQGRFSLKDAAAYLPMAGIELQRVALQGRLRGSRIQLQGFSLESGGGKLSGAGELQLLNWRPGTFQLQLEGENFQCVNLPELQLWVSPDLRLSGSDRTLQIRGQVRVPEALVVLRDTAGAVAASPDLTFVDSADPGPAKTPSLVLDGRFRILLGDHVLVKGNGIDARLGGEVELSAESPDDVSAQGKIHVVQGAYSAYGIGLKIERGNVLFAGGPVDRPTLDILALRTVNEVKVGVLVSGTPKQPVVKLYSEPLLPDMDILSYIVLGRPLGSDRSQSNLLMSAAGVLLSQGESALLQDRLKRRLGLDVLEVQAGNGDVTSSMVTIGKYLNPKLYVGFGHALFNNSNELRVRYRLGSDWEFESNVGLESGADLYYRMEFD